MMVDNCWSKYNGGISIMSYRMSLLVIAIGFAGLLAGCSGQGNVPPIITEASVTPSSVRFIGGNVTIAAKATDDGSVTQVFAVVEGPVEPSSLPMTLSSDYYACEYSAAPNSGPGDQVYSVEVVATDNLDLASAPKALSFTVEAPPAPPGTPPL